MNETECIYDTNMILHSSDVRFKGYITKGVLDEIKDEIFRSIVRNLLKNGKLKIVHVSEESKIKVRKINEELGNNLSETDIEVLAGAYEHNLKIITSDFAIQNIARILNIPYEGIVESKKITKRFIYICPACEKIYKHYKKICDVCGTEIIKKEV